MTAQEQATVNAIWKFLDEQEKLRVSLREVDQAWRGTIDLKVDRMSATVDDMKRSLANVPCVMDDKIKACRDERVGDTEEAVEFATDLKRFGVMLVKLGAAAGVITGAILGIGKLFGWY
jgi:hypothetical protein